MFHYWRYDIKKRKIRDQNGLRVNSFFRNIAFSLVNLMSVIFIFQLGRAEFWGGGIVSGLVLVLLYRITVRASVFFSAIWVGNNVIRRIGYRRSILWSTLLSAVVFLLFAVISYTRFWPLLFVAGGLVGLGISTYWTTFLTLFTDDASPRHVGSSVGIMDAIGKLGQVAAPLIGALITITFGYEALFAFAIVFLVLSSFPMFFLKHHLHFDEVSWREFFKWNKDENYIKVGMAIGGHGIDDEFYVFLWPLYVFLTIGSIEGMGIFGSVTLLATAIFSFCVSKLFDRPHNRSFQVLGVAGAMIMWGARLFVTSLSAILMVDTIDKLFVSISRIFFLGRATKRASGRDSFSFMVYWEVWRSFWLVLGYTFLLGVLLTLGTSVFWPTMVITAATGLSVTLLLQSRH